MRSLVLFALLACVAAAQEIHLKTRTITTSPGLQPHAANAEPAGTAAIHRIVQFDHPLTADDLEGLIDEGALPVAALPDNAVMVSAPAGAALGSLGVRWTGRLNAPDKLSPDLGLDGGMITAIVEFHADVPRSVQDEVADMEHLALVRPAVLAANHAMVTAAPDALRALADRDEVAYIFPAGADLVNNTGNLISCAGMLTTAGAVAQYSNLVHGWSLDGDQMAHLGYIFGSVTPKVPALTVKSEIVRALNTWAVQTNITFEQKVNPSAARTVMVKFVSGAHGDAYAFDGSGGVLAHTFYPPPMNGESVAGDIHMDADENWHAGGDVDIYSVALHEAGHALGLGHSDKPNDVMYPYYRSHLPLSANDIGAIQALYGVPGGQEDGGSTGSGGSGSGGSGSGGGASTPGPSTPSLTLNTPASPTVSAQINITGTVTGGAAPYAIQWQTDRGYSGNATVSGNRWTASEITLASGANTITFTVFDGVQQTGSLATAVTQVAAQATQAGHAPVSISINVPPSVVSSVSNSTLRVAGTASAGAGVMGITWQTSNGASGSATGGDHWLAQIPLLVGTNTIVLKAWDNTGRTSRRALVVIRR